MIEVRDLENQTRIAVAVVHRDNQVLVGRRPDGVPFAGLAEFPGGKVKSIESPSAAAVRECFEETGIQVEVVNQISSVRHAYRHGLLELDFFACRVVRDAPPLGNFHWVDRAELSRLEFPPANADVLARLSSAANGTSH